MYALTHCTFYTGDAILQDHALVVEGENILGLCPAHELSDDVRRVDGQGLAAAPGFIDLQLNGCGGVMFNDDITSATLDQMHRTNLHSGTTSFLPTLITTSDAAMLEAIAVVAAYRRQHPDRVLGLHLEGPYLNPQRRGIHAARYVRSPDTAMIDQLVAAGPEVIKLITLAPEVVPASMIRRLVEAGIRVSAGHSAASFEDAIAGFESGISLVTHLFNAMSPWQGRSPGLVGATFDRAEVYAGIIADGHHVHYASLRLAHQIKGDHLLLVTDATPGGHHHAVVYDWRAGSVLSKRALRLGGGHPRRVGPHTDRSGAKLRAAGRHSPSRGAPHGRALSRPCHWGR